MLYLLHNHNLVGFTRKKDKQKGWYIYYWTLLPESITFLYLKKKKEMVEQLKQKLDEEGKELFFVCPNNCARLNFDQAMDFEFHCPECGELLSQDASQKTEEIKKKIDQIEGELKSPSPEKGPKTREIRPKNKKVITRKLSLLRKKIKLKKR
jgi:transcription initiation factor TFIIE subunit alpha